MNIKTQPSTRLSPSTLLKPVGVSAPNESAAPPPSPHELERQRKLDLLAKVRVSRDRLRFRGAVEDIDPNKVYVWLSNDENTRTRFEGLGYVLCKSPTIKTAWRKEDNTHRRGDLILYEVDKDLYEAIKLDGELRALEGQAAEELFLNFADSNRIPAEKLSIAP